MKPFFAFLLLVLFASCLEQSNPAPQKSIAIVEDSSDSPPIAPKPKRVALPPLTSMELDSILELHDTTWVDIKQLIPSVELDLRYATTNNFMKLQIYDCPKCYLRLGAAKEIINIQHQLKTQNLGLKIFDCYRPQSAQYKLWQKKPDPRFVAPPNRGSMHSRGGAIDLTIIDLESGRELDMGTEYDYFGHAAYWTHKDFPQEILDNRQLLLETMRAFGFKTITTEWWHFSYRRAWFKLSNMQWDCASFF